MKHDVPRCTQLSLRIVALGYLFVLLARPDRRHPVAHLRPRASARSSPRSPPRPPSRRSTCRCSSWPSSCRSTSSSASPPRWRWCAGGSAARGLLQAVVDLPFAVSPIVVGVSLIMLWGAGGWFGGLDRAGFKVIFGLPGMVLATIFVTLPFVVREVEPVLHEIGHEQEQAAVDARRQRVADLLADHAAGHPVGPDLRRRAHRRPGARRVRRGHHGVLRASRGSPRR